MTHHDEQLGAEGAVDRLKGGAKEAWGDLTNNESLQAEGEVDQLKGSAKQAVGNAVDTVEDAANHIANEVDRRT